MRTPRKLRSEPQPRHASEKSRPVSSSRSRLSIDDLKRRIGELEPLGA
jgi:hypothetical protein